MFLARHEHGFMTTVYGQFANGGIFMRLRQPYKLLILESITILILIYIVVKVILNFHTASITNVPASFLTLEFLFLFIILLFTLPAGALSITMLIFNYVYITEDNIRLFYLRTGLKSFRKTIKKEDILYITKNEAVSNKWLYKGHSFLIHTKEDKYQIDVQDVNKLKKLLGLELFQ